MSQTPRPIFVTVAASFLVITVALATAQGTFTYKSSNREIIYEVQAGKVEIVTAILSFISLLVGIKK